MSRERRTYVITPNDVLVGGVRYQPLRGWPFEGKKLLYRTAVEVSTGDRYILVIGFERSAPYEDPKWGPSVEVELPTPTEEGAIVKSFNAVLAGFSIRFYS